MVNRRRHTVRAKNCGKTKNPYGKTLTAEELKSMDEYGLQNIREVWRAKVNLSKIQKKASELLKLEENDAKRSFEGNALLRRLARIGVLNESSMKLDDVLSLTIEDFFERRLQTQVFSLGMAKSIHEARMMIGGGHIRVRDKVVNIPSYIVGFDSQEHITFSLDSPFRGARPGVKGENPQKETSDGGGGDEEH